MMGIGGILEEPHVSVLNVVKEKLTTGKMEKELRREEIKIHQIIARRNHNEKTK